MQFIESNSIGSVFVEEGTLTVQRERCWDSASEQERTGHGSRVAECGFGKGKKTVYLIVKRQTNPILKTARCKQTLG